MATQHDYGMYEFGRASGAVGEAGGKARRAGESVGRERDTRQ